MNLPLLLLSLKKSSSKLKFEFNESAEKAYINIPINNGKTQHRQQNNPATPAVIIQHFSPPVLCCARLVCDEKFGRCWDDAPPPSVVVVTTRTREDVGGGRGGPVTTATPPLLVLAPGGLGGPVTTATGVS